MKAAAILFVGLVLTGCATTQSDLSARQDTHQQNPHQMVGVWQGWLITPDGFTEIRLEIRDDASFELGGEWGIQSTGNLITADRRVWFEGSRGWRGTLRLAGGPDGAVLKFELDDRLERATLRLVSR